MIYIKRIIYAIIGFIIIIILFKACDKTHKNIDLITLEITYIGNTSIKKRYYIPNDYKPLLIFDRLFAVNNYNKKYLLEKNVINYKIIDRQHYKILYKQSEVNGLCWKNKLSKYN